MRALPIAAAVAAVVLLAGCAQPAAEESEAPTTAPTSEAPSPTAEPTPSETATDPHADWRRIETPNGTASFLIPPGWTAEIGGEEMLDYDGLTEWSNSVVVSDADSEVRLSYWDGPGDNPGVAQDYGIVREERIEPLDPAELEGSQADPSCLPHSVRAWWDGGPGSFAGHVAVTPSVSPESGQPFAGFSDGHRLIFFGAREEFSSKEDVVAWLERDVAAAAFEVLMTLDLSGAPGGTLPGD